MYNHVQKEMLRQFIRKSFSSNDFDHAFELKSSIVSPVIGYREFCEFQDQMVFNLSESGVAKIILLINMIQRKDLELSDECMQPVKVTGVVFSYTTSNLVFI